MGNIAVTNGMTTTREFDALGRLSRITIRNATGGIVQDDWFNPDSGRAFRIRSDSDTDLDRTVNLDESTQ